MRTSDEISEISEALVEAQSEMENPPKNATASAGKFSYDYTTLDELIEDCQSVLNEHGVTVIQGGKTIDGIPHITTRLLHESGQWIESTAQVMTETRDPQDYGKGITYSRRYSLSAMLGIASEEDDDAAHTGSSKPSGGGQKPMADNEGSITENQRKAIHGKASGKICPKKELDGKSEIISYIKSSSDVDSLNDLSKSKASNVIDWLDNLPEEGEHVS